MFLSILVYFLPTNSHFFHQLVGRGVCVCVCTFLYRKCKYKQATAYIQEGELKEEHNVIFITFIMNINVIF